MFQLKDKTFFITGVANKKSVAFFVAKQLKEMGAKLILSVQMEEMKEKIQILFPGSPIFCCDVQEESSIQAIADKLKEDGIKLAGFLHSIAFARFSNPPKAFHEVSTEELYEGSDISCFSLIKFCNHFKELFTPDASVVTISISNTRATSYGYLGPIKAMLDATVAYLAKSLSSLGDIRVNAVCAGPLKTAASSGIPNYIDNYLFAEQLTMRKKALQTQEVANVANFLLSPLSSGINAANIVVDAGMNANYFDEAVVKAFAERKV